MSSPLPDTRTRRGSPFSRGSQNRVGAARSANDTAPARFCEPRLNECVQRSDTLSGCVDEKIIDQMQKVGLPSNGPHPFKPKLTTNHRGDQIIEKRAAAKGPKQGKRGYVDDQGRTVIKDRAHAGVPEHWDVQINDGDHYIRVDLQGSEIP